MYWLCFIRKLSRITHRDVYQNLKGIGIKTAYEYVKKMGIKFPLLFIQESFIQEDFEIKYCCVPKSSHHVLLVASFPFCLLFNL